MPLRLHLIILAQAVVAWGAFWVAGWPRYYQQYSTLAMGAACTVLSVLISLAALYILARTRPERRRALALWLSFYYTVPFALLDTLYCAIHLGRGAAYLHEYWYLTVFYFTPWITFPPTAWILDRVSPPPSAS